MGEGGGNPSTFVSAFRIEVSSFKQVHFFNLEGYCQYACALVLYHHNDVESCMILGNLNLQGVGGRGFGMVTLSCLQVSVLKLSKRLMFCVQKLSFLRSSK